MKCKNCGHDWKWHFIAGCIDIDEITAEECKCKKFESEGSGLKVIDGTPTAISKYLREKKQGENLPLSYRKDSKLNSNPKKQDSVKFKIGDFVRKKDNLIDWDHISNFKQGIIERITPDGIRCLIEGGFYPMEILELCVEKKQGCGKMYCSQCNNVDESHSAYCITHQRSSHYVCNETKLCPKCDNLKVTSNHSPRQTKNESCSMDKEPEVVASGSKDISSDLKSEYEGSNPSTSGSWNLGDKIRYKNTTGDVKKMFGWFKEKDVKEKIQNAQKRLKEKLNQELIDENRKWGQALLNRKDDGTTIEHIFDRFFTNMQSGIRMEIGRIFLEEFGDKLAGENLK